VPTRVRKPRDKAKVEVAVQVVERWVLARLRHRRFFSLGELNTAIRALIEELNTRTMRRIGCSRHALFEAIERTALLSLQSEPFEYAEWKRFQPGLDYHVEVHGHWYSVPYRLIREVVEARVTDRMVEIFHHGVRVAAHVRSPLPHRHTALSDHMPSAHRRHRRCRARSIGPQRSTARSERRVAAQAPSSCSAWPLLGKAGIISCWKIASRPSRRRRHGVTGWRHTSVPLHRGFDGLPGAFFVASRSTTAQSWRGRPVGLGKTALGGEQTFSFWTTKRHNGIFNWAPWK
jgi:transposase